MKQSLEAMQRGGTTFFNVLGWVVDFRPPLKTAKSQMKSTCSIRDSSSEDTLEIAVFRGRQEDLPQISSPGDIVLFRDIRVRIPYHYPCKSPCIVLIVAYRQPNIQRQGTAWTNTGSSWTVFPYAELADRTSSAMAKIPHTSYPPSWHPSAEELAYVRLLHKKSGVYAPSLNAGISTLSTAANLSVTQNNSANTLAEPRGLKFRLIEKVKAKEFVDLVVQVVKIYSLDHAKVEAYVTDYTENKDLYKYSQESEERDGDRFTYIKDAAKEWRGPWGQRTVQICCFHHHGYKIKEFNEDDVVELKNVHIKYGKEILRLEGAIYKDHIYPDRVQVFRADKDDNRVKALMRRRTEYWEQAKADGLRCPGDHDESKKRKHELQKGKGKKRSKTDAAGQATKIDGSLRAVELKSSFLNTHGKHIHFFHQSLQADS
jgi:protection of telomeres protein 1